MLFFRAQGFRVIAHDRRGHGRSTQLSPAIEMDTYAADAAALKGLPHGMATKHAELINRDLVEYVES